MTVMSVQEALEILLVAAQTSTDTDAHKVVREHVAVLDGAYKVLVRDRAVVAKALYRAVELMLDLEGLRAEHLLSGMPDMSEWDDEAIVREWVYYLVRVADERMADDD